MGKFFDTHTHSEFSPDSRTTVEEILRMARRIGAGGVTLTDHLDLDAPRNPGRFEFSIDAQQEKIEEKSREIFPEGSCKVLKGIEVGLQPCSIAHSLEYISGYKFDQITVSVHFVDGEDPYYGEYYKGKDFRQAYGRTLELIYETARDFKDFDVIGHFDYVARYAPYEVRDVRYADFPDILDTLLRFMAQEGKALEINTKTYDMHGDHLQVLDENILRRFKELGGEFVTLGSDSHSASRLTEKFEDFAHICRNCGFEKLTYFEDRRPVLYSPF
ncbi:MAG: histidinol-phosphatase HisJ family protein [Bacteroidales bacterium]|nr:histidinol-phosphatase HisJ family protein [Bacteroidales bacterium]